VALLGTSEDTKDLVKTAFASALQNMTPADLMVVLHGEGAGRKAAMEGECRSDPSYSPWDVGRVATFCIFRVMGRSRNGAL
jgi:hypothetical protein